MESTNENPNATGKKGLSAPAATVTAAVIGGVFGIVIALIGIFPNLRQGHGIGEEDLRQTIPAPAGSETWEDVNGTVHRYWAYRGFPEWEDADVFCKSVGGHLVTITSSDEQDFVEKYVGKTAPHYDCLWIGVKYNSGNWNQLVTGDLLGDYDNWDETPGRGGYAALSNYRDPYGMTFDGWESKIEAGKWVRIPTPSQIDKDEAQGISITVKEGWLICEWEYD